MNTTEREAFNEIFTGSIMSDSRTAVIRTFEGGATRNNDPDRIDFLRMMSLEVLFAYADYMRRNRRQTDKDGNLIKLRDFDNWKGGFPPHETAESLMRHVLDLGALTDGIEPMRECNIPDTCCALIFGATAYLHKHLKERE